MSGKGYIPFLPEFEDAIKSGRKTLTARTKKYAPGDYDTPFGGVRVHRVIRLTLGVVRSVHWREEGCDSPEDFERVWNGVHPQAGFRPDQVVYLHEFQVVPA